MAAVALLVFGLYLLMAFGVRGAQQYRRTGDFGFRGVSGRPGSLEWWGGALFALALVLGLAAPILVMTDMAAPLGTLDHPAVRVAGVVLAAAGTTGTLAAQHSMGASWRVGVDRSEATRLVTTGAFAWARNPVFTAMITAGLGIALLAPNLVALTGLAALTAAIEIQVRAVEEPYLLTSHGRTYRDYAARTGRFLPGLGRLT